MLRKITNLAEVTELVKDDPVRPHIDPLWRITPPREVYIIKSTIPGAMTSHYSVSTRVVSCCCVAFTNSIPISEMDLVCRIHTGNIAVFYTVWSKEKGMGRKILFEVLDILKKRKYTKYITLSSKTEMAKKFHFSNGATLLQQNHDSYNFEYGN